MNLYKFYKDPEELAGDCNHLELYLPDAAYKKIANHKGPKPLDRTAAEKLETVIAKSANFSMKYAENILKHRFIKGEDIISTSAPSSYIYAKLILGSRFRKGEDAIADDIYYSYQYAVHVLKGRFEKGEAKIKGSTYWEDYCAFINYQETHRK